MLTKADPQIKETLKRIKEIRRENVEKYLEQTNDFYNLTHEYGNDDLKNLSSVLLGDACCLNNDYSYSISLLTEGINGVIESGEIETAAIGLNEMGVILHNQGHYIAAEEALMRCITLARENGIHKFEAMANHNFAGLCRDMDDYEDALFYYRRALEAFSKVKEQDMTANILIVKSCMVMVYIKQDNELKATTTFREMEILLSDNDAESVNDMFEVQICRLWYSHYINDQYKEKVFLENVLKRFEEIVDYTKFYEECISLFEYLYACKEYELMEEKMNYFRSVNVCEDLVNQFINTEELYLKLYKETGQEEKYNASAVNYVRLVGLKNEDIKKTFATTARLQNEIYLSKHKSIMEVAAEDRDKLTGLPTKRNLALVADELFEEARSLGVSFGVGIIDVDNFTEMNEAMGHEISDDLLRGVANVLSEIKTKNIYISRFTSDEFVIIYMNMEDSSITQVAKRISDGCRDVGNAYQAGRFTVSQGIINCVPQKNHRTWDFFSVADEALFLVKMHGKGTATLLHNNAQLSEPFKRLF